MAKFKRLVLTELGNTTDAYDWQLDSIGEGEAYYTFFSENYEYEVSFSKHGDWIYTTFDTVNAKIPFEKTNEGNQFRVVGTVMETARNVWNRRNEITLRSGRRENVEEVKGFSFDAYGKKLKLYKTFINTQFPDAEIFKDGSEIKVKPNKV